jgi:DNA-binding CsgD family transcriptional regulator
VSRGAPPAAELGALSGPLATELHERLRAAVRAGEDVLGHDPDPARADDEISRRELIEALTARCAAGAGDQPSIAAGEPMAALARLRQRFETRFRALDEVRAGVDGLREITAPAAMLAAAPGALCACSQFRRAIVSHVARGRMVAEAVHVAGDPAGADRIRTALADVPVLLEHPLVEVELLRRRRATIVDGAAVHPRVDHRLAGLMAWDSYAAAPLLVGSRVIGVLHADRGPGTRLEVLDADVLWEFATGLAQAHESAVLRRTLRSERAEMRRFLDWLGARSGELTDAPVRLATVQRPPRAPLLAADVLPVAGRDDRVVFEGLLTRRELDVLRLLADGRSNKAIAQMLVISDGTVKFHVNSILRKLHVANRAEAVARYLRLLGMRTP